MHCVRSSRILLHLLSNDNGDFQTTLSATTFTAYQWFDGTCISDPIKEYSGIPVPSYCSHFCLPDIMCLGFSYNAETQVCTTGKSVVDCEPGSLDRTYTGDPRVGTTAAATVAPTTTTTTVDTSESICDNS